jgi:WD40 repeat protein
MNSARPTLATILFSLILASNTEAQDAPPPVSFLKDVAPILVQNCIACHNPRKSESKYTMTTFAQLAKGGVREKATNLVAGDPDGSNFIELCKPDGEPRMPYKQDPLPKEKFEILERWVKEGAKYDGTSPTEDWPAALRKATPVEIPEVYPATVPITALAFSPDGAEVLASGFHELTTWKMVDGSPARRVRGMAERIHDIAYSPDGKWMATASGDPGQFGSVQLWSVEPDGGVKLARDLLETTDSAFAVAFSPDGTKLAAAGADRAVRVWDIANGKEIALIEDHADWIFDLAWSPDGKRLATASRDKTSKVFDVEKKESIATFPGHAEAIYSVSFTPDGKSVVTGGADHQIRVWNPDEDAKQVRVVGGFGGAIFRLLIAPDGKTMIACGADKTVRIFDSFNPKQTLSGHNDWVYSIALSPDGKTIASGAWDGEVRLWNLSDGKPVRTILAAPGYKPGGNPQAAR